MIKYCGGIYVLCLTIYYIREAYPKTDVSVVDYMHGGINISNQKPKIKYKQTPTTYIFLYINLYNNMYLK